MRKGLNWIPIVALVVTGMLFAWNVGIADEPTNCDVTWQECTGECPSCVATYCLARLPGEGCGVKEASCKWRLLSCGLEQTLICEFQDGGGEPN